MSSGVSSVWKSIHVRLIVALDGVKLMLWLLIYTHWGSCNALHINLAINGMILRSLKT